MNRGYAKYILGFAAIAVVVGGVSAFNVPQAQALFGIDFCGSFFICLDPISDISNGISAGANTTSAGANTTTAVADTAHTALAVEQKAEHGTIAEHAVTDQALAYATDACKKYDTLGLFNNLLDQIATSVASAGDRTQTTGTLFIQKKIGQLELKAICLQGVLLAGDHIFGTENTNTAAAARRQNLVALQVGVNQQLQDLNTQLDAGLKGIFEAIATSVALNLNQKITTNVVNGLVAKYKIGSYLPYADALVTQVYAMDYINKNYPKDKQTQLMLTSLLNSKILGNSDNSYVRTTDNLIKAQIQKTCPSTAQSANWRDPNYYATAYALATPSCNAAIVRQGVNDKFNGVITASSSAANSEINNSGGYRAQRDCNDISKQSANISAAENNLSAQIDKNDATTAMLDQQLRNLYDRGATVQQIATAQKAYDQSIAAYNKLLDQYNNLPEQLNGGVVLTCNIITHPGPTVAAGISSLLNAHLQQATGLDSKNMPLIASLIGKVSSNLISNIISGSKPGSLISDTLNTSLQAGIGAAGGALINGIGSSTPSNSDINQYLQEHTNSNSGTQDNGAHGATSPVFQSGSSGSPPGNVAGAATIRPRGPALISR